MKISIITPSYQQNSFLERCLNSVAKQTYNNIEHIVIDPGSTDGSLETISKYTGTSENARSIIGVDNNQVDAINIGLREATGDYLTWLNSDDFYVKEDVIEKVVNAIRRSPKHEVYYGRGYYVDSAGSFLSNAYINKDLTNPSFELKDKIGILQPSLFFDKEVITNIGLLDEEYNLSLDYEYWLRIAHAGYRFKFVDVEISGATMHPDSKTKSLRGKQLLEIMKLQRSYYGEVAESWIRRKIEYDHAGIDGIVNSLSDLEPTFLNRKVNRYQRLLKRFFVNEPDIDRTIGAGGLQLLGPKIVNCKVEERNRTNWITSLGGIFPRMSYKCKTEIGYTYKIQFDYFDCNNGSGYLCIGENDNISQSDLYIEGYRTSAVFTKEFVAKRSTTCICFGIASTLENMRFGLRNIRVSRALKNSTPNVKRKGKSYRRIVTSFNAAYFSQGLTLINSIFKYSFDLFDEIWLYDLGLNKLQRERLLRSEKLKIIQYDRKNIPYAEYLNPKNYSYKCFALNDAGKGLNNGDLILWLDSGVIPMRDLESVFSSIAKRGYLFVDHNETEGWPFFNCSNTDPRSVKALNCSAEELLGKHICSAVMGYTVGMKGHKIAKDAYEISLNRNSTIWSKHPKRSKLSTQKSIYDRQAVFEKRRVNRIEDVYDAFPFYGHRQDQTIYSILAKRNNLEIEPGIIFRRGSRFSSFISKKNWETGGEFYTNDKLGNWGNVDEHTEIYQHRGVLDHSIYRFSEQKRSNSLIVLGNGPSLAEYDLKLFSEYDTVGCNSAYRYWEKINWYPDYYACLDETVLESHIDNIYELIKNHKKYGIRLFLLRQSALSNYPQLRDEPSVIFLEDIFGADERLRLEPISTGSHSTMLSLILGYEAVVVFGIDLNYVEKIDGAKSVNGTELIIEKENNSNPNYFFEGYQRVGDRYNIPNPSKDLHVRAWMNVKRILESNAVVLFNANPSSRFSLVSQIQLRNLDKLRMDKISSILFQETEAKDSIELKRVNLTEIDVLAKEICLLGLKGKANIVSAGILENPIDEIISNPKDCILIGLNWLNHKFVARDLERIVCLPGLLIGEFSSKNSAEAILKTFLRLGYYYLFVEDSIDTFKIHRTSGSISSNSCGRIIGFKCKNTLDALIKSNEFTKLLEKKEVVSIRPDNEFARFESKLCKGYKITRFPNIIVASRREKEYYKIIILDSDVPESRKSIASKDGELICGPVYSKELEDIVPYCAVRIFGTYVLSAKKSAVMEICVNRKDHYTVEL